MGEISIHINGEVLDLLPGTILELEEENPFLQMGNEIRGQYSLPFTVPLTEKNIRLLAYSNVLQTRKTNDGLEAILFVDGVQHSRGRVKRETSNGHIIQPQRGTISLYYLFGISDFFKTVENIRLDQIDHGNDYSFPMGDPDTQLAGTFFNHVSKVMQAIPNSYDYAFIPILNRAGLSTYESVDTIINNFTSTGIPIAANYTHKLSAGASLYRNELCPFPYLKKVLENIFAHIGWKLEGDILSDADFKKIVILHNRYIQWVGIASGQPVSWNMRNHVPRVKISSFLISIQNRFGLNFDIDFRKKIFTLRYRNDALKNRKKRDISHLVSPNYSGKLTATGKVYGITNGNQGPDLSLYENAGQVNNFFNLPAASAITYNRLYYVRGENAYWACQLNPEDDTYLWQKVADNTFDFVPDGKTDDINTNAQIPGSVQYKIYDKTFPLWTWNNLYGVMPDVTIYPDEGETESFYLCYHHPLISSINDTSQANVQIPFGGTGCQDLNGNLLAAKSLSIEHPEGRGLYANNWQYFFSLLGQREEITIPIHFTTQDLFTLNYSDTVIIRHTEYVIKNPHFSLPLKDYSTVDLIRI